VITTKAVQVTNDDNVSGEDGCDDSGNKSTLNDKCLCSLGLQCGPQTCNCMIRLGEMEQKYNRELRLKDDHIAILTQQITQLSKQTADHQFDRIAERYSMTRRPHGIAVIINNYMFHSVNNKILPNRRGSQIDEENLCKTWKYLNYEVHILRNLSAADFTKELMKIALQNHENYDSFVCCILSHGYLEGVYGTDCKPVSIADLANIFKGSYCPSLAGKPKLFFI